MTLKVLVKSDKVYPEICYGNEVNNIVVDAHLATRHPFPDKSLQFLQRKLVLIMAETSGIIDQLNTRNLAELRN